MCRSKCLFFAAVSIIVSTSWCQAAVVKIYWAWNTGSTNGGVERVDPDASNRELLTLKTNYPAGIDVNPSTGKVYYTLAGNRQIRSCDLDGGDNKLVTTGPTSYVRGIDLDILGGKMYWAAGRDTSSSNGQIQRANLNGSSHQYLYAPPDSTNEVTDVSLDLINGIVYWTDYGSRTIYDDGAIGYGSLDGSMSAVLTNVGGDPRGVAVDPVGGNVYWSDYANNGSGAGMIYRTDLDLGNPTPFITGLNGPNAVTLDVAAGHIYWSDNSSGGSIRRANLADSSVTETLVTSIGSRASDIALLFDNLPAAWTAQDIGSPAKAGFTVHHEPTGRFVVESAGAGLGTGNDEIHYVHRSYDTGSQDFTAIVRLWSHENTHALATAGLMARDGTDPAAPFVMTFGTPENGVGLQWRDGGGEAASQLAGSPNTAKDGAAPVWLVLRRRGDTFHAYYAEDKNGQPGVWSGETTQTVALPANLELGMAVSSHDAAAYGTGIFDNVKIGNWEPRAKLKRTPDGQFIGSAYALDDLNGDGVLANDEVVDVQWRIDRVTPAPGLMSQWFLNRTTAGWTGSPDYRLVAPIPRTSAGYCLVPPGVVWIGESMPRLGVFFAFLH